MSGVGYYGCIRDEPDDRDFVLPLPGFGPGGHSGKVDLREYVKCIHVYDQGQLNSCTANAVCSAYSFILMKKIKEYGLYAILTRNFDPARLFLYYNARKLDGLTNEDCGCRIQSALRSFKREGVCGEHLWPYDKKRVFDQPDLQAYRAAKDNVIQNYERMKQDINQFRACLDNRFPFVFSFQAFDSFEHIAEDGEMPMPTEEDKQNKDEEKCHAVLAVGYDDAEKKITVLNSWGEGWGHKGFFYMPYEYIKDPSLCFDFWKITDVERSQENFIVKLGMAVLRFKIGTWILKLP